MSPAIGHPGLAFEKGEDGDGVYTDPDGDRLCWAPYQRASTGFPPGLRPVRSPGPAVSLRVITEDGADGTVHVPYEDIPELVASLMDAAVRAKREDES